MAPYTHVNMSSSATEVGSGMRDVWGELKVGSSGGGEEYDLSTMTYTYHQRINMNKDKEMELLNLIIRATGQK